MRGNRMALNNEICRFVSSVEELDGLLSANGYVAKREMVDVLYLALRLEKALLLEGPPGAGKTQVAKVLSVALGMPLIRLQCYEGIGEVKALYQWNETVQRIALEYMCETCQNRSPMSWPELKGQLYRT